VSSFSAWSSTALFTATPGTLATITFFVVIALTLDKLECLSLTKLCQQRPFPKKLF
jgi:hypothetical protein